MKKKTAAYTVLTYAFIGRFSVDVLDVGEYVLRVENITDDDIGMHTCIDAASLLGCLSITVMIVVTATSITSNIKRYSKNKTSLNCEVLFFSIALLLVCIRLVLLNKT